MCENGEQCWVRCCCWPCVWSYQCLTAAFCYTQGKQFGNDFQVITVTITQLLAVCISYRWLLDLITVGSTDTCTCHSDDITAVACTVFVTSISKYVFMPLTPTVDAQSHYIIQLAVCPSVHPSVVCLFVVRMSINAILCDATSLYLAEGFWWNLAKILFVMWVDSAERVLRPEVKGQGHSKVKYIFPDEGYPSTCSLLSIVHTEETYVLTVWHRSSLVFKMFFVFWC